MKKLSILLFFLGSLVITGCVTVHRTPTDAHDMAMGESMQMPVAVSRLAGDRIEFENQNELEPGIVKLRFKLLGLDGKALAPDDLQITHEKKMHFLLVRDDMTQFQHLHPEFTDGYWQVETRAAEQGNYQMYIDVTPTHEGLIVLRVPLVIGGATLAPAFPVPVTGNIVENGLYRVKLVTQANHVPKEESRLVFQITRTDSSVPMIGPYLGAYGHVVIISHNSPDDFIHAHPATEEKPVDGAVEFLTEFPKIGRYTLYAQFDVDNTVLTFPVTIDIH